MSTLAAIMRLRSATIGDLELLRHWDEQPHVIESDPNDDWNWEVELGREPDWREQLVAEVDGRAIGFVQIIDPAREESHYWGECEPDLRALDIWIGEERDLGQGFGTQMMWLSLERCFQERRVTAVLIDPLESNTRARKFYERLGFRFVEHRSFDEDECAVYRMTRQEWRALSLVRLMCSNQVAEGLALVELEPSLATHDLYAACACGEVEFVKAALSRDSQLATAAGGPNNWTPLTYVCFARTWRRDPARAAQLLETARVLLAHGADPNSHYLIGHEGRSQVQSCLFAASGIANNAALTRLLLESGANADELVTEQAREQPAPASLRDFGPRYPQEALYHACEFQDVACLSLLLQARPTPLSVSYCLGRALDFDHEPAALLFLEHGADPGLVVPWNKGRSHLHKAVMHRRSLRVVRAMLEAGASPNIADDDGRTPYQLAVRRGEKEIAELLEEFGAETSSVTEEDQALGRLMRGESAPDGLKPDADLLVRAARRGAVEEVSRLLSSGADPNADEDVPPLHSACYAGQMKTASLLVERGASLTQKNAFGGTALGTCIYGSADCFDVEGGPSACPPDEIPARDYAPLADWLISQGSPLPEVIWGGSSAVQEVLRRHGVADQRDGRR